jgi:hypothetical protein
VVARESRRMEKGGFGSVEEDCKRIGDLMLSCVDANLLFESVVDSREFHCITPSLVTLMQLPQRYPMPCTVNRRLVRYYPRPLLYYIEK